MRGPGQEAAGLRAGAGGDGGEERHVAPQPASVHHPGPVSGPEGGSQPSDQLHVSLARLQPAELPPAAPRTQRAAQRAPVSDELLLPRPAPRLISNSINLPDPTIYFFVQITRNYSMVPY